MSGRTGATDVCQERVGEVSQSLKASGHRSTSRQRGLGLTYRYNLGFGQ